MGAVQSNPPANVRRSPDRSLVYTTHHNALKGIDDLISACNESGHPRKTTSDINGQQLEPQYTEDELLNKKNELTAQKEELEKNISSLRKLLDGLDESNRDHNDVILAWNFRRTIDSTRFDLYPYRSSFDSAIARLDSRLAEISPEGSP